ncbi:MAG: hypothetical protein V1717_01745, partial [Candidatus Micrarchaeota archaeon]
YAQHQCFSTPARYGESAADPFACAGSYADNPGDDKGTDFVRAQGGWGWCTGHARAIQLNCVEETPVLFQAKKEFSRDSIEKTVRVWDCTEKGFWWKQGVDAGASAPSVPPASKT